MNQLKNTEFEPTPATQLGTESDINFPSTLTLNSDCRSSTGTFDKISIKPPVRVSRETILASGTFSQLYQLYREENHHIPSAALRALSRRCEIRYQQSASDLKTEYKAVQEHPHGWSQDKSSTHKHNIWSVLRIILDTILLICRGIALVLLAPFRLINYIAHHLESALHGTRALTSMLGTIVLYALAAGLVTYTVYAVRQENEKQYRLKVFLDDTCVGCADSVSDVLTAKHTYEKTLSDAYGIPVVLPCTVRYEPYDGAAEDVPSLITSASANVFQSYMDQYLVEGYGLYIDNKLVAVTDSAHIITETMEDYKYMLQQNYMRAYQQDVPESFVLNNDMTVIYQKYPKNFLLTVDELRSMFYLDTVDAVPQPDGTIDYANAGKSASGDGNDFLSALPSSEVEMHFNMVTEEIETEVLPYTIEYVYDDTMYQGMRRMVRAGVNGKKQTRYRVTYSENKIIAKEVIEETVITQPTSQIVRSGTMEVPENLKGRLPTGSFIYPYQGTISSYFGWRNIFGSTSFHCGIDIAGPANSTIVAADGGQVIEVSYEGTYGNYVLIRHDENTVTRYAHCNSILVQPGDLVGQGYPIALMGHTGRATGDHVHFEVILNGSVVDPLKYLR